jgi:hypothetical protein
MPDRQLRRKKVLWHWHQVVQELFVLLKLQEKILKKKNYLVVPRSKFSSSAFAQVPYFAVFQKLRQTA